MIENILRNAIIHSRIIFRGKSSNKNYRYVEQLPPNKREKYTPAGRIARENRQDEFSDRLRNIRDITEKYKYCLLEFHSCEDGDLVGNCSELSIAIFNYLAKTQSHYILRWFAQNGKKDINDIVLPIYILFLKFKYPYDHCMVVITQPGQTQDKPFLGKKYSILPDKSWICDSWANIVCTSEQYDRAWRDKMYKWNSIGKATTIYEEHQSKNLPWPLDMRNYKAIIKSQKKVSYMAVIKSNGMTNILS
ncbi:hypothetical protein FE392_09185 [Xenorhabdus sp. 12]|uniref:Uncharacterized protein n=1 Tax=Xenorhabdus santafensis TaxID=2582833 RepID=A0ABU4S9L7_9GAMM|nr:hypothetical protein [Xenorhabdus sp. 12]MDX7987502.1 hypothetical protein [Xenorhabdus sp. 12]